MSKISVVGTGYVGLIQAVGLAKLWQEVTCIDSNQEKIWNLKAGIPPIYEDGLAELLKETEGKIRYVTDLSETRGSDAVFVCVWTPQDESGKTDLGQVRRVTRELSKHLDGSELVVLKSTVPVGTNRMVSEILWGKNAVVSNPEFLREGLAIRDFFNPDRVVLGYGTTPTWGDVVRERMRKIYSSFAEEGVPFVETDWQTAELIKYSANSFLATKISYMNEIARYCDIVWANVTDVIEGMGLDPRIWKQFLNAGIGYGGSCFPKDVKSLVHQLKDAWIEPKIVSSTDSVNESQVRYFLSKITEKIWEDLEGIKIGVVGIAFKPDTDDIRESRWVEIIESLLAMGADIRYFDYNDKALANFKRHLEDARSSNRFDPSAEIAHSVASLCDCDAIVIAIEDRRLTGENWNSILSETNVRIVFDGRNILNPETVKNAGAEYVWVGKQ